MRRFLFLDANSVGLGWGPLTLGDAECFKLCFKNVSVQRMYLDGRLGVSFLGVRAGTSE